MHNLGVKLQGIQFSFAVSDCSNGRIDGVRYRLEKIGVPLDAVAVTHPDRSLVRDPSEKVCSAVNDEICMPILPLLSSGHLSAKAMSHELHTVTDAQDRNVEFKNIEVGERCAPVVNTCRTSGQNNSPRLEITNLSYRCVIRVNLRLNPVLPDAPRNKLRVLRAEIKN